MNQVIHGFLLSVFVIHGWLPDGIMLYWSIAVISLIAGTMIYHSLPTPKESMVRIEPYL